MRKLIALLLFAVLLAPAAMAQVPRTVIAEDCTATWCVYCPDAYAGLEVMKSRYDANEFMSVRYYDTSGALGNAKTHGRITYYNVSGFPTVVFDGTTPIVGGGSTVATGSVYDPEVVQGIALPAPIAIHFNNYSLTGPVGSVNLDLQVVQTIPDISNVKIRVLVLENNVTWQNQHETDVVRSMLNDVPMTVSQLGQDQNVALTFPVDPSWKTNDLWIAVFVQNDTDKSILQSDSTRPTPAYSLRYWAQGPRADVAPSSGTYEFPNFAVYNMGVNPDNFTVAVNNNHLPAGWTCVFTDGTNDYANSTTLSLNPGESRVFHLKVTPNSPGYVDTKIVLTEAHLPSVQRNIGYTLSTNDVQVLLVKHDGGDSWENYYIDGLQNYGVTFGLWNSNYGDVTSESLATYPAVVWECGFAFPTLSGSDRQALSDYFSGGGKLFLTGQDIAWDLGSNQGAAAAAWMQQYLHADFVNDNSLSTHLTGVSGDLITNGMAISITGGDGANNQTDQDSILPHSGDPSASTIFTYDGTSNIGGVKADTGTYKTVFLTFGYEGVSTQANRRLLMSRILDWFNLRPASAPDAGGLARVATIEALPNPTRDVSTLRFSLPSAGTATLQVYGMDGALVRTLVNGARPAGTQSVVWDGRNNAGERVGSGVYLYRLKAGDAAPGGKVVISR